jgi:hypothetical protein
MRPPIVLWAVPRSVSTAFERVMRARGDLTVFSEPFSAPYYLGEERVSARFGAPSTSASTQEWASVVKELVAATKAGPVFVKDMAYHVSPRLDRELVGNFQNTFIVRHPGHTLRSLKRLLPDFTLEEAGFEQQYRLMRLALEASDEELVVLDGEELRRSPATVVEDYCRRVGLPFLPESLTWQAGLLADWMRWEEWHGDVAGSTGIRPPRADSEPARPDGVDPAVYARCVEYFEKMVELGRVGDRQ